MGLAPRATAPDASSREAEGGIRDDGSLAAALATGCARVALGTAALERPDWVRGNRAARRPDRGRARCPGHDAVGRPQGPDGGELFDVLARLDADGRVRHVLPDVRRDSAGAGRRKARATGGQRGRTRPGLVDSHLLANGP